MAEVAAGLVFAGVSTAVQANQQKIAAQKQKDALADAQAAQDKLIGEQKKADADRKKKEEAALQQGFTKVAAARKGVSGADLPGAVAASSIGAPSAAGYPSKKLIGS
jgi:hypothetical protein